jgi:hypothetical protein
MVADEHGTQLLRLAETYQLLIGSHDVLVEICAASINPVEKSASRPRSPIHAGLKPKSPKGLVSSTFGQNKNHLPTKSLLSRWLQIWRRAGDSNPRCA